MNRGQLAPFQRYRNPLPKHPTDPHHRPQGSHRFKAPQAWSNHGLAPALPKLERIWARPTNWFHPERGAQAGFPRVVNGWQKPGPKVVQLRPAQVHPTPPPDPRLCKRLNRLGIRCPDPQPEHQNRVCTKVSRWLKLGLKCPNESV